MAKKKTGFDYKHLAISSGLTVLLAELVPMVFFGVLVWWQGGSFGSLVGSANFFNNGGTYTADQVLQYGNFALGVGVILTLGMLIYLSTLIVDEWFFSHRLDSLRNVLIYGATWALAFFVVDSLLAGAEMTFSLTSIYTSTSFIIATLIFAVPLIMYFVRRYAPKKGK